MRKFRAVKCDSMNLMCGGIFFVIQAYRYISCFIFHNTDVYFLTFACDRHGDDDGSIRYLPKKTPLSNIRHA